MQQILEHLGHSQDLGRDGERASLRMCFDGMQGEKVLGQPDGVALDAV